MLSEQQIDFYGEPLAGLQIMGMLETRTLDFKRVIITSMNEGILPAGKSQNSFIPYDLKGHFEMPTHQEKDAVYAYHFYRLLQRAEEVWLIYDSDMKGVGAKEKSRFILQIENELKKVSEKELELLIEDIPEILDLIVEIKSAKLKSKAINSSTRILSGKIDRKRSLDKIEKKKSEENKITPKKSKLSVNKINIDVENLKEKGNNDNKNKKKKGVNFEEEIKTEDETKGKKEKDRNLLKIKQFMCNYCGKADKKFKKQEDAGGIKDWVMPDLD